MEEDGVSKLRYNCANCGKVLIGGSGFKQRLTPYGAVNACSEECAKELDEKVEK